IMQTLMDKQQKFLVKKFHILLGKAGIDECGKRAMLASYGVGSSLDLGVRDLLDLCHKLELMTSEKARQEDMWRKRLMAAIGGYLRAMYQEQNAVRIKAIACRAADIDDFNRIPLERLRSLYHAFMNKTKDLKFVDKFTADELDYSTLVN
nr:hypothetical protein [Petrimonas sp.]